MTDPDLGGPKTYGSYGFGSGYGYVILYTTQSRIEHKEKKHGKRHIACNNCSFSKKKILLLHVIFLVALSINPLKIRA